MDVTELPIVKQCQSLVETIKYCPPSKENDIALEQAIDVLDQVTALFHKIHNIKVNFEASEMPFYNGMRGFADIFPSEPESEFDRFTCTTISRQKLKDAFEQCNTKDEMTRIVDIIDTLFLDQNDIEVDDHFFTDMISFVGTRCEALDNIISKNTD